ncbi:MAG: hypothetical protein DWG76_03610 [Chloroflexi bacterium]|nr:CvpA family protein [Chloroflexota bacterium]MQC26521.1 hypothetical protein [Chloroflexota bacterium]
MITLNAAFWLFVLVFAVIGAMRGWAKELLVTFSVILAIFIITVVEQFVPFMSAFLSEGGPDRQFLTRAIILMGVTFFGYQTPNFQRISEVMLRESFQDSLLGFFIGLLNGYFVVGSIWFYLHRFGYPYGFMFPPVDPDALNFIAYLPPAWLGIPAVYFAVAIAFTFVVVVLI